jgi:hypothetical protein
MRSAYGVVAGWGAGLIVLLLVLLAYYRFDLATGPLPVLLLGGSGVIMMAFALVLRLAIRLHRVGTQRRQPRRSGLGVSLALAVAVALLGFALDWWVALFGSYGLLCAAFLLRGDRAPLRGRLVGATTDAVPGGVPQLVHDGGPTGHAEAMGVPELVSEQLGPPSTKVRRLSRIAVVALVWRTLRRRRQK